MKLSQLSTDNGIDILVEITPHVESIANDKFVAEEIRRLMDNCDEKSGKSDLKWISVLTSTLCRMIPFLFKEKRYDLYSILAVLYDMSIEEIKAQSLIVTMRMVKDIFSDKDFILFFKKSVPTQPLE